MADTSYQPKVYREQGGARQVVASGGSLDVESGGELDVEAGGALKLGGTAITSSAAELNKLTGVTATASELNTLAGILATAAEINRVCDRSTRQVAAGATLAITEALHDGKTIALDQAAGSVCTLPAPTIGMRVRFLVTVKPTSNFHQIKVAAATDFLAGVANILDLDAAAQQAFQADGAADDNIQLDGTTKGGQVGDWIEIEGISATQWAITAQLTCPAGSNPADMFSAAV